MNFKNWKPYLISAAVALSIGTLSGLLSIVGMNVYMESVTKPALTPPEWIFPVVWTLLYILMGIGSARIWMHDDSIQRSRGLNLYVVQLILNFFWSLIFFNAQAFGVAVIWLLLLLTAVVLMTIQFYKVDRKAAYLQIPYIIWLVFATYLSIGAWYLNK